MTTRDVFTAIADPTRRRILEVLVHQDRIPAGTIASLFPDLSRPAVSRHLRVLRECRVVRVERGGKQQCYSLEPEPLETLRENWLEQFSRSSQKSLQALRAAAEAAEQQR